MKFAKLSTNGQGNILRMRSKAQTSFLYSTNWNDFTYYQFTDADTKPQYHDRDISSASNMMFSDLHDFVQQEGPVTYSESSEDDRICENLEPQENGLLSALIPQDFNLDIEASGDITGQNYGDSKLLAMKATLKSQGLINVRRLRADQCTLEGSGVNISSSLEALHLKVKAGERGFQVGKRLGLNEDAHIESEGEIRIGSLFCMMRNLPVPDKSRDFSLGVKIHPQASVEIDSL